MSEMKRISGSGKTPYVWKNNSGNVRRSQKPLRSRPVYSPKKKETTVAKPALVFLAIVLVATLSITVCFLINMSADKATLLSMERRNKELRESLEACELTLKLETRSEVICQLAEERLYMVKPASAIALNIGARGESMTAGR